MKSVRRHELQHNELADWLVKTGEEIKPYLNLILAATLAVLVGLAAYSWWSRSSAAENVLAWNEFNAGLDTGNLETLAKVISDYSSTTAAGMAAVVSADSRLAMGCNQLFSNKALGLRDINAAIELYSAGLAPAQPSALREQATFGLARAKEAKGEIEPASRHYRELVEKWPNGVYAADAKQRLADLQLADTKEMFDDFRNFDPKPVFDDPMSEPGKRPSAEVPDDPAKLNVEKNVEKKTDGKEKAKAEDKAPKKAEDKKK